MSSCRTRSLVDFGRTTAGSFATSRARPNSRLPSCDQQVHQHRDGRRIGPAAERDDELPGVALPQIVEQRERHGAGEFFFLLVLAGFPRRMPGHVRVAAGRTANRHLFAAALRPVKFGARPSAPPSAALAKFGLFVERRPRPPRRRHVDQRRREHPIGEREPRPADEHLAAAGDERAAVVDRPARFVAQQIGVGVAHAERPRAFEHEPLADLLLGEREMARAGVEQDVGPALGEPRPGAVGDPGVAANFEADPHVAARRTAGRRSEPSGRRFRSRRPRPAASGGTSAARNGCRRPPGAAWPTMPSSWPSQASAAVL